MTSYYKKIKKFKSLPNVTTIMTIPILLHLRIPLHASRTAKYVQRTKNLLEKNREENLVAQV